MGLVRGISRHRGCTAGRLELGLGLRARNMVRARDKVRVSTAAALLAGCAAQLVMKNAAASAACCAAASAPPSRGSHG